MRVAVLIPARAEGDAVAATLGRVSQIASEVGGVRAYLVDDGSEPAITLGELPPATAHFDVVLLRHVVNLGQGAALETARQCAISGDHDVFVTMDADGQHDPRDLPALVTAVMSGADVAFGNRFAGRSEVPGSRALVLHAARLFELALTGQALGDAHNGYRALSAKAARAITIRQARMAHATEIRVRARRLKTVEVPVTIRYTDRTRQKGQSSLGSVHILRDLFHRFLFGGS
jgi:glycosyltransferase involved in cell wall biosynthesis